MVPGETGGVEERVHVSLMCGKLQFLDAHAKCQVTLHVWPFHGHFVMFILLFFLNYISPAMVPKVGGGHKRIARGHYME